LANRIYPKYKEALLNAETDADLGSGSAAAFLVDTGDYTFLASHEFKSDIPSTAITAISSNLIDVTVVCGVFDCSTVTWVAVSGDQSEAIIFFIDDGTASGNASRLVCYLDTGQTGLPVTPNGGDITFTPSSVGVFVLLRVLLIKFHGPQYCGPFLL